MVKRVKTVKYYPSNPPSPITDAFRKYDLPAQQIALDHVKDMADTWERVWAFNKVYALAIQELVESEVTPNANVKTGFHQTQTSGH